MARTKGARNADYEDSRLALARKVRETLSADQGLRASLRELAEQAGTSVATLKHYFKDREGLVVAVMESLQIDAAPYMAQAALPTSPDLKESLTSFLTGLTVAWRRFGVGPMHGAMLAEGLAVHRLGPRYVTLLLEPLLQLGEQFLQRHVDMGQLAPCDLRHASLALQGPVVLALLHQDNLGGVACRPLPIDGLIESHVEVFLRAFPAASRPALAG